MDCVCAPVNVTVWRVSWRVGLSFIILTASLEIKFRLEPVFKYAHKVVPRTCTGIIGGSVTPSTGGVYPVRMVPSSLPHRLVWCLALHLIQPRIFHLFARWPARSQLKRSWFSKKNILRISMVSTDLQSLAQWSFLQKMQVGLETCTFFSLALPFGMKKWDSFLCSLDSTLFLLNHLWILLIRASISQLSLACVPVHYARVPPLCMDCAISSNFPSEKRSRYSAAKIKYADERH